MAVGGRVGVDGLPARPPHSAKLELAGPDAPSLPGIALLTVTTGG